ncbi:DUF5691 domain-containing protein [Streptomyces sp. MTZ3.1]|uniref:DUF5691 domain-containing protein n=1 Tax=Streptomyces meridianus TaxID=2938945 RepID=A0ABT0XFF7_9ACTN|nr:DUF5691 domain-containing protein [Streptomyces meridianus]MCM2580564.1 DUF5691 domain-containing protein [Streptomyces meridianus]
MSGTCPPAVPDTAWEDLVSAALLGTERRPIPAAGDRDPAAALLDAAAVRTLERRAGLLPAVARPLPSPAPADPRDPLPPAARHRLATLLADRAAGGRRGTAPVLAELLPQWLTAANRHGYRAPDDLLPGLLDAARARSDLRDGVLTFAGPRGRWLAGLNPDWKFALRAAATGAAGAAVPSDPAGVHRLWEEGLFAERTALLTALRQRDPAGGLDLLRSSWPAERAEDRLMFLDALRTGLGPADEAFLEEVLGDRSRNVRTLASELLALLPGSALSERMARRAAACVVPQRTPGGVVVVVEAPHECDAGMQRDGITVRPPSGRGERSWWLSRLLESAPLGLWGERFGGLTPEEIVALPVADGRQEELHAAWGRAAVARGDVDWSRALLGSPLAADAGATAGERTAMLAVLPADERAEWVAGHVSAYGPGDAFQFLGACAVPWSEPLGRAVVDALDIARDAGGYPWSLSGVMGLAERCLDPELSGRLEALTVAAEEPAGPAPGTEGYWSEAFQRLAGTLRLRAALHRELDDPGAEG